ncbi:GTPase-activating protein CdGAPr [Stomoxys calcitrans]|uniref:GTPase-activating protein CdGAPr n=1 Tax=Stomoxys calcitrans TaxID=35570 RepID=UPI0027E25E10|nr:GTPase-activating protein CdGAPr [Stomoxys calcitrans]XP_059220659.1 GTPase-activating protein CdGAPr [Stomoxys calcitrans]XP_059220660.1 GTPase-activating protein CdGAPr [Stomoxys calcitrans]
MADKLRSTNMSSSLGPGGGGLSTLIGNPTLISSTLSTNHQLTPTVDLMAASVRESASPTALNSHQNSDMESSSEFAPGTITAQLNFQLLPNVVDTSGGSGIGAVGGQPAIFDYNSIMNSSQISAISHDSLHQSQPQQTSSNMNTNNCMALVKAGAGKPVVAQSVAGKTCRFPKLEDCAHFHYERVQLGPLSVRLVDDKSELLNSSIASQSIGGDIAGSTSITSQGPPSLRTFSPSSCWFIIKVFPHRSDSFLVKRSFDNMQMLDEMLHRCVYDRKISGLKHLSEVDFKNEEEVEYAVAKYLERFSKIASDSLTCGTILTWLQLDNKGRRLPLADDDTMRTINTPAVGAAYGVRRYLAQASDEISIEVGDMISVIDMPSPAESIWWRGKKSHLQKSHYEVGFFPQSCVATIGDKIPRHFPMPAPLVGQVEVSPTKPVLRKHGKLIAFFRSFILSRPSRRRLKQSGIYRERVFSCDLSEHLLNSGQEIPMVLKCCAEYIEEYGIVDGIYRLSGITSNIQKLRRAFDEERIPDLGNPEMKQDIHAVSSLLKMYFRELPNPLCTYQLYDNFVEAIQAKSESNDRLRLMKETVLKLPPPHYRTLKYLSEHLNKISQHAERTGMTDKNLAIVWAPNLLRSPALESGGVAALRGVGVQAVVTEYLIRNCHLIFDALEEAAIRLSYIGTQAAAPAATAAPTIDNRMDSLTDCESLLVEQREHDQSISCIERPKSLSAGGPKLISLEEAQERHHGFDMKQSMPINMISSVNSGQNIGSYIEVGGGPSSLPDKYHTVLSAPRSWQKRKTHSWKSLFSRNQRPVSNGAAHDLKSSIVVASRTDNDSNSPPPRHKDAPQVTFADADSIIGVNGKPSKSALMKREEKHKSIELFDTSRSYCGEPSKPIEVCVRSNSIDSLRTAGHSRSVSHDSYFDLLQSPQRGHMTTCPSRELSELGLNFDREEPEMRIFSESESLVSSPRVGKENIPPSSGSTSRRIMRARPEEFSSQTNSVNPSPKKQPRLNLLLSPSTATSTASPSNWSQQSASGNNTGLGGECHSDACHEHNSDESCCKRYKLEDQLSDIQFIDCGTPEHTVANTQTLYASVQVHAPPKPSLSKSSLYGSAEIPSPTKQRQQLPIDTQKKSTNSSSSNSNSSNSKTTNTRYSYPSVQLGSKRKDQDVGNANSNTKERFSYPGTGIHNDRRLSSNETFAKMLIEEVEAATAAHKKEEETQQTKTRTVSFSANQSSNNSTNSSPKPLGGHHLRAQPSHDLLKVKNRNSYCVSNESLQQQLLRSYSGDITKDQRADNATHKSLVMGINEMEQSKLSVTPSSPIQSPRYSLLVGDTSSENSSAVNTPQHDLDPLMVSSAMSGISGISGASSNQMHQMLLGVEASSYLGTSAESIGSNMMEKRDMQALKRELSLDLNPVGGSKLSAEAAGQRNHNLISPNSNFTDNTSQSVTPSEYGYQNLQRQLSMHSLIETDENSPAYEEYENTPSNLNSPMKSLASPIKSTISITYNLKSPTKEEKAKQQPASFLRRKEDQKKTKPLETSFDESTVYEQVKFFRNSVTEVNQMLNDERKYPQKELENLAEVEELSESEKDSDKETPIENYEDMQMSDEEKLLYENVELRKPKSVYQNLMGEEMKALLKEESSNADSYEDPEVELDSLDSIKDQETETIVIAASTTARRSPSNFSVKELATKFEVSPIEQMPAFDFSVNRSSMKKTSNSSSTHPERSSKVNNKPQSPSCQQKLTKTQQITRSLDENAFIREFGNKNLQELNLKSSQQLPQLNEAGNRRKSFDFTRPKTLNPPKRLPGMAITEEYCSTKSNDKSSLKIDLPKEKNFNNLIHTDSSLEHDYERSELKITPTTENRISLIQNNVHPENTADLNNSNVSTNSTTPSSTNIPKVLSGVKLDRERIDRIKEERRQQLTQKYHADSFKSKSKTDLNISKNDDEKFSTDNTSLRVKSKSRADMRTLQKDMDNLKEFGRNPPSSAVSETTLNTQHRVRSISDEKNQNNYEQTNTNNGDMMKDSFTKRSQHSLNKVHTTKASNVGGNDQEEFSARATVQKFERKSMDFANGMTTPAAVTTTTGNRERTTKPAHELGSSGLSPAARNSISSNREKISPQFSIRDVTAMFESRSQNQQ